MKYWPLYVIGVLVSWTSFAAESENYDAAAAYQTSCFACHGTGQAHAPVVGDVIEWEIRAEKGMETLVQNTINGLNGIMPARGLCADCSDEQLRAIVEYMLEESK
ncbi:MAG: c-type cytochrome [Gammaproteobacteria bacterium]|nr:c-type cytochrome [Gammaproteobacteria bacterium]MDD9895235.1 c-type cytochrome [Gammaproteobacteria bacterium]MDD9958883.1 c-type cytochrome [Gammaproteobacteria bacterium]